MTSCSLPDECNKSCTHFRSNTDRVSWANRRRHGYVELYGRSISWDPLLHKTENVNRFLCNPLRLNVEVHSWVKMASILGNIEAGSWPIKVTWAFLQLSRSEDSMETWCWNLALFIWQINKGYRVKFWPANRVYYSGFSWSSFTTSGTYRRRSFDNITPSYYLSQFIICIYRGVNTMSLNNPWMLHTLIHWTKT